MSKPPSPQVGFNDNVRHKNKVFHIQTEDSGVNRPHVITHLFMDGGRILKSVKQSYADHVGVEGLSDIVRKMMKDQHKEMFVALKGGQFDHLLDDGKKKPVVAVAPEGAALVAESPPPVKVNMPSARMDEAPRTVRDPRIELRLPAPVSDLPPPPPSSLAALDPSSRAHTPLAHSAERAVVMTESSPPPSRTVEIDGAIARARPASIFGNAKAPTFSAFGGADKSLEEMILRYVTEES